MDQRFGRKTMILNLVYILYFLLLSGIGNASVENDGLNSNNKQNKSGYDHQLSNTQAEFGETAIISSEDKERYQNLIRYAAAGEWDEVEPLLQDLTDFMGGKYIPELQAIKHLKAYYQQDEELDDAHVQVLNVAYYRLFQEENYQPFTPIKIEEYLESISFFDCYDVSVREDYFNQARSSLLCWVKENNNRPPNFFQIRTAEEFFKNLQTKFSGTSLIDLLFSRKIQGNWKDYV